MRGAACHRRGANRTLHSRSTAQRRLGDPRSLYARVLRLYRDPTAQQAHELASQPSRHTFQSLKLQTAYDTFDPGAKNLKLPFMKRRTQVVELMCVEGIVVALTASGVCGAFDRDTNRRLCVLNVDEDEVVRSLFVNRASRSIIVVSVFLRDEYKTLKCRSILLDYIRRGKPEMGFELFESESLRWPGFVEFDDVNHQVLTFCSRKKQYGVWDLKNYDLLYMLPTLDIAEIKISPGIMLLIHERQVERTHLMLSVVDISTGKVISTFTFLIHRNKKIEFIEQFNEKLLVKQEGADLNIFDIKTRKLVTVPNERFPPPNAFIFLYEDQRFLTFVNTTVYVWDFDGKRVAEFEDHQLFFPDCSTSGMFISNDQKVLISYCRDSSGVRGMSPFPSGTLNFSRILDGKSLYKISREGLTSPLTKQALKSVTSVCFDEERGELYTGTEDGYVEVWFA